MIDWRVVLGALGSGVVVTFWLESRSLASKKRWLIGMLVTAVLSISLFIWTAIEPWWTMMARFDRPPVIVETADGIFYQGTMPKLPTQPPPRVFLMNATENETTMTPPVVTNIGQEAAYLRIPALSVARSIVTIPLQNGRWDISQLGGQVGRLSGTGTHPGGDQAMVFVGHMTFPTSATLEQGAFANLQSVTYGTEVIYHQGGHDLVYEVTEISRINPSDIDQIHLADGNSILLLTCTDWDGNGRVYANRLLVRASLVPGQ
jgi:LPXTG-site transpeptidase (sortase) family protein